MNLLDGLAIIEANDEALLDVTYCSYGNHYAETPTIWHEKPAHWVCDDCVSSLPLDAITSHTDDAGN